MSASRTMTTRLSPMVTTTELFILSFFNLLFGAFMAIDKMASLPNVQMTPFYSAGFFLAATLNSILGIPLLLRGANWRARICWSLTLVWVVLCALKIISATPT